MEDFEKYKKIHIVGIKGAGVAALAGILKNNGYEITGSDIGEDFATTKDTLNNLGIKPMQFGEADIENSDAVLRSVAYSSENNLDIKKAEELKKPIFTYPEVVSYFFNNSFGIAVAGSHGKTTTTAMLADLLKKAGKNVTALVGSKVNSWGAGFLAGDIKKDDHIFVLEADEYKRAFLNYKPKCAIITSVDYDHPDCYKTNEEYKEAFLEFLNSIPQSRFVVCDKDYEDVMDITKDARCKVIYYGKDELLNLEINVPGEYNLKNANAAFLTAIELGINEGDAKRYLSEFAGTARRFEILGQKGKAIVVDDYAHHPSEIKATILGAKSAYPLKKIAVVFEPHTYSRTKKFADDFVSALSLADEVILTDVFSSAREKFDGNFDIKGISDKIGEKSVYIKEKSEILDYCQKYTKDDTILIFMGAGDLWKDARDFLST